MLLCPHIYLALYLTVQPKTCNTLLYDHRAPSYCLSIASLSSTAYIFIVNFRSGYVFHFTCSLPVYLAIVSLSLWISECMLPLVCSLVANRACADRHLWYSPAIISDISADSRLLQISKG